MTSPQDSVLDLEILQRSDAGSEQLGSDAGAPMIRIDVDHAHLLRLRPGRRFTSTVLAAGDTFAGLITMKPTTTPSTSAT